MNVDRLSDGDDDPRRAADTTRLTESPQPETPDPPQPKPDPQPQPEREPEPRQQREPERKRDPESRPEPEQSPESPPPPQADSPAPAGNTPEPAEPRTRQEHADTPTDGRTQRQGEFTEETRSTGDSNAQRAHEHEHALNLDPRNPYDDSIKPDDEAAEAAYPRTEEQRAEHIADVFGRLDKADAEGSSSNELHTIDPKGEIWSSERTLLHHSLLDEIYSRSADVPCDREAIVAGGLSGAGKTTVLANHPEIDRSKYLIINPDNIKEEMARYGMIPEVEGLSPMEASELAHEESSYLARQLAIRAQADGKNLIWDITMSDQAKTEQRITDLREAGYVKVDALFVQIPIETSLERTEARYWADQDKWLAGEGLGGRLIPPEVILRQADEEWGSSNRKTLEAIKGIVDNWEIQDNSVDGRTARLVDRSRNEGATSSKQKERGL